MKFGEVYGAISKRLNKGITYININSIDDEVGCDEDDIKSVADTLCQNGLARCINQSEYELICDIGQLRDFTIKKQNEGTQCTKKAENDEKGDKPVTLETIKTSEWKLASSKEENEPMSLQERFRRLGKRRHFDIGDEEDDDDDEEMRKRILEYIRAISTYNEEDHSFEPEMRVLFPNSDIPLVLDWAQDEDGDIYLSDKGALYNYLLDKMIDKEGECAKEMVTILIAQLVKSSSFSEKDNKLINYLTGIRDTDRIRIEISYFAVQFGKYLKNVSWLLDEVKKSGDDPEAYVNNKIDKFVKDFSKEIKENTGDFVTMVGRVYVHKIYSIDPRITRKQGIRAINELKSELLKNGVTDANVISGINDAISRLNIMSDRLFAIQKIDAYIH